MPTIVAYVHAYVPIHNAGAETTMHDILKNLVEAGWEAQVVVKPKISGGLSSGKPSREYSIDGVNVIEACDRKVLLHYVPRADVTISHLECSSRTHLLSNSYKIPTVHLVHNTHPLTARWMQPASALILNTEWIANEKEWASWNGPKMVLNPPVNPREYKTTRGKSVTLVNLWEDKGAEVFYGLAERMPDTQFLGVKGGYGVQEIREYPNVTIMDHTSAMKDVYGNTKVILMPSKYESFGRVGVEAMASGIPTIAHPTPGLKESLGDSGTFVDRDDLEGWETALRSLLTPAKYGRVSKLALARSNALDLKRADQLDYMKLFMNELVRSNGKGI